MPDAPLYTEPIIGYRIWSIASSPIALTGIVYTSCVWNAKKPTHAMCMKTYRVRSERKSVECKHPPEMSCNDGMFAFYDLERLKTSGLPFTHTFMAVRGTVQGWGKVILHEDGYRTEYAQPIAFINETEETMKKWVPQASSFFSPKMDFDEAFKVRKWRVEVVAKNYDVPIIPEEDIEEFSRQYGALYEE